jgi:hypothetical protein
MTPASGVLASNVAAVKFDFTSPTSENGYVGYSEIAMFGAPSIPPAVPTGLTATLNPTAGLVMQIGSLVVGRNYEIQSATNLTAAVWNVETNFVAGATSVTITNGGASFPQKFYRVRGY